MSTDPYITFDTTITLAPADETPAERARIESVAKGKYQVWAADKRPDAPSWDQAPASARQSFLSSARRFCQKYPNGYPD